MKDRFAILSAAFRAVPLTCGPLTLRPITAGTVLLLMDTGNPLFSESAAASDQAGMDGLFQFIYIHTAPPEEVLESCEDVDLLRRRARALALAVSFEDLADFSEQFQQIQVRLNAGIAEVVPEKGAPGKPEAPPAPTGLPTWCMPSAAAETQPASNGSSGASPSTAPSNTCTPPTPQTESAPAGRSRIWEPDEDEDFTQDLPENAIPLP